MAQAITLFKFNSLTIESLDGKRTVDISNSVAEMDYFENILEPSITMKLELFNVYSLYNELPIRGGEKVEMEFETASTAWEGDNTINLEMYVYKISNLSSEQQKEVFTLHLISKGYFLNETSRCLKKYEKITIGSHVEQILTDVLGVDKSRQKLETTSNSFTFIGNNKKPFHTIQWLAPKSIPTSSGAKGSSGDGPTGQGKGTAGFLFWENIDGYNFTSIDTLVSKQKSGKSADQGKIYPYVYTPVIDLALGSNNFKIIKFQLEKNIDLRKALRVGMYQNYTYFYDIHSNVLSGYKYDMPKEVGDKTLAADGISGVGEFDEKVSRVMFRMSDQGTLDPHGLMTDSGRDDVDMAKSFARYNLLFTQALNILIPCNTNLKVGDIIWCSFPRLKGGKSTEHDPQMSGHYLIRELRHHFEANKNTTSLKLMRDSYGEDL